MRFTVLWTPISESQLARIWATHPDHREQVSRAADFIDLSLREDPEEAGRDHHGDRILRSPPLSAIYSIDDGDRKVLVLAVRFLSG